VSAAPARRRRGALLTLLLLAGTWPAWMLGGEIVERTELYVLDLLIRAAIVLVYLCLAGEAIDRLAARGSSAKGNTHG
jgi:hypothetical protein